MTHPLGGPILDQPLQLNCYVSWLYQYNTYVIKVYYYFGYSNTYPPLPHHYHLKDVANLFILPVIIPPQSIIPGMPSF